jgi:hypothetical protein
MQIKIAFIAPSGFGKSTAIDILKKHFLLKNIKIAAPLYSLQGIFYSFIGRDLSEEQDGELLQFLGGKIRKENADFLLRNFSERLHGITSMLITNDDCRPYDYDHLKKEGFIFVQIKGFRRNRDDHTPVDSKSALEWQESLATCDYILENTGALEKYEKNIINLMEGIINDRESLCRTNSESM